MTTLIRILLRCCWSCDRWRHWCACSRHKDHVAEREGNGTEQRRARKQGCAHALSQTGRVSGQRPLPESVGSTEVSCQIWLSQVLVILLVFVWSIVFFGARDVNYNTVSRPGLCAHRVLTNLQSHGITCLSDLALSASLLHTFGIHCLPIFVKHSHFLLSDVISKRTTFSQPFLPPSDPPANAPWFFLRHWRYINHLLTYLLT